MTVIPAPTPLAYCVHDPGRIVLTDAAVSALEPLELAAVLAHERAHLRGRHHLTVTVATALARAFPGVPVFSGLRRVTSELVEILADDSAVRRGSGDSLVGAIAVLGIGSRHAVGLAANGGSTIARVTRLLDPPRPLPAAGRFGGLGAAATLLLVPALVAATACPLVFL